ncbi:cation diffusion facilitator 1 [Cryptococcus deuterogattii 99/473]|uniref:Cation diffusion facilitator 1 n=1 Tax=Cryptococcus deuterogattii Ram5 TaxID=1296110 RepID=A0A0D0V9H5_9TREE|nr:cation diffusion facilitator 1 [Cryptococcus deuterogattii Ram5]KIR71692.1 cation diffusion facilitator 1 [Cryptococcus deuterogattii CA1014]KIR98537.1 cation diffusion facilitator 1 [Cryptococcus deuterogattii 2001/935-1]KIY56536.1 cation diffusion facilitator 1 [Cryptococcus deuterogattii 99/473]
MSATAIATEVMDHNLPSPRDDLELVAMPSVVGREAGEKDPYSLRTKMIGEDKIKALRQRKTGGSKLASFYESQNEHINDLLKPMSAHSAEAAQDAENNALKVKIAVNASLVANTALAILQLYAAISSMSLALFASCIDAVDPFANLILWLAHRRSDRANENKWPVRGSRFETSDGNIIYGSIMGGVNVILVVESIQEFVTHTGDDLNKFHLASIVSVAVAFGVKFCLFLYCLAIRKSSSQVQVLWEDHRNDLLTNGFSILTAAGGAKLRWWIDPMGATMIAMVIITVWTRTVYEQFTFLAGITAPPDFINLVTYKAMTFSPSITSVDTVRAYHSGPQYFVEVDIVLPPEMPLWEAHDIAQDLQDQIEKLKDVDRCFVHVDHEISHEPEHRKKV